MKTGKKKDNLRIEQDKDKPDLFWVVRYEHHVIVRVICDVKHTREEAEEAVRQLREGTHPTQWKPS